MNSSSESSIKAMKRIRSQAQDNQSHRGSDWRMNNDENEAWWKSQLYSYRCTARASSGAGIRSSYDSSGIGGAIRLPWYNKSKLFENAWPFNSASCLTSASGKGQPRSLNQPISVAATAHPHAKGSSLIAANPCVTSKVSA